MTKDRVGLKDDTCWGCKFWLYPEHPNRRYKFYPANTDSRMACHNRWSTHYMHMLVGKHPACDKRVDQ